MRQGAGTRDSEPGTRVNHSSRIREGSSRKYKLPEIFRMGLRFAYSIECYQNEAFLADGVKVDRDLRRDGQRNKSLAAS